MGEGPCDLQYGSDGVEGRGHAFTRRGLASLSAGHGLGAILVDRHAYADQPDIQPRETSLEFIKRLSHGIDDLDSLDASSI